MLGILAIETMRLTNYRTRIFFAPFESILTKDNQGTRRLLRGNADARLLQETLARVQRGPDAISTVPSITPVTPTRTPAQVAGGAWRARINQTRAVQRRDWSVLGPDATGGVVRPRPQTRSQTKERRSGLNGL